MEVNLSLMVAGIAGLLAVALTTLCWVVSNAKVKRLNAELVRQQQQITDLKKQLTVFTSTLEESQARSFVVAENTEQVAASVTALQQQIKALAEQDPDSRLYHRAAEMLQSGASIDEVMHSCDLPLAEVQLLANLHSPR